MPLTMNCRRTMNLKKTNRFSTMVRMRQVNASDGSGTDDLKKIKGIGPSIERTSERARY